MIKYRIEGQYLDQFQDEEFAVTKAISKIGEIDLRHGDFSTSFKVPLTARNIAILRYTPELNNRSDLDSFKRYNGALVEDDVVVSDGYYQVTGFNATKKEASLKFFGGNSEWFDLLKDRYINIEVEEGEYPYKLNDYNHIYNVTNISNSWDGNEPYFYYVRDNGENSSKTITNNFTRSDFGLGYYEHRLFSKIFESVDIKLKGTLFNDSLFYNTIVTTPKDVESVIFKDNNITNYRIRDAVTQLDRENVAPNTGGVIPFTEGGQNTQWNNNIFTAQNNINDLRLQFLLYTEQPNGVDIIQGVDVYYRKNNGTWNNFNMNAQIINNYFNVYTYEFANIPDFINVVINDTFEFKFYYRGTNTTVFAKGEQYSYVKIDERGVFGQVTASELLPKIKQTDFVKDIMFRAGVVSQYDVKTRTLTLDKFEGIDTNRIYAPDWSNKIDLSKDVDVDYTKILSNYAKKSIIEHTDDSENDTDLALIKSITGEGLGDGVINIDNDFLSDEKSIYTSPLSATMNRWSFPYSLTTPSENWYIPFIPTKKANGEDNEINTRVLIANKINVQGINNVGTNSFQIDFTGTYSEIGYAYFTKIYLFGISNNSLNDLFDNLMYTNNSNNFNVGDTLLQRNFNLYGKILNDPIYISLYMNLTALDVQQVDFLTPIYLDFEFDNGYYYIDSIEQYKGNGTTTKVNLVKI